MPWLVKVVAMISKGFCKMTKVVIRNFEQFISDIDAGWVWRGPRIANLTQSQTQCRWLTLSDSKMWEVTKFIRILLVIEWRNLRSCSRLFYPVNGFVMDLNQQLVSDVVAASASHWVSEVVTNNTYITKLQEDILSQQMNFMKRIEDRWFSPSWSQMTLPAQASVDIKKIMIIMLLNSYWFKFGIV